MMLASGKGPTVPSPDMGHVWAYTWPVMAFVAAIVIVGVCGRALWKGRQNDDWYYRRNRTISLAVIAVVSVVAGTLSAVLEWHRLGHLVAGVGAGTILVLALLGFGYMLLNANHQQSNRHY